MGVVVLQIGAVHSVTAVQPIAVPHQAEAAPQSLGQLLGGELAAVLHPHLGHPVLIVGAVEAEADLGVQLAQAVDIPRLVRTEIARHHHLPGVLGVAGGGLLLQ